MIVCIVRITYIMSLANNPDVTYSQGRAAVWSCVELNVGIVCASVIVLKPFVRQHFPGVFSSYILSADNSDGRTPIKNFPPGFAESKANNLSEYNHPNTYQLSQVERGMNEDGSGLGHNAFQKDSFSTMGDEVKKSGGITVTKTVRMNSRTRKESKRNMETDSTEEINASNRKYSRS